MIRKHETQKRDYGYNVSSGGGGCSGWNHTEKTRKRLSKSHTGKKLKKETIEKCREIHRDRMKPVITPYGEFESLKESGRQTGINWDTIRNRCNNPNFPEYQWV